jgi:hypothetical protein
MVTDYYNVWASTNPQPPWSRLWGRTSQSILTTFPANRKYLTFSYYDVFCALLLFTHRYQIIPEPKPQLLLMYAQLQFKKTEQAGVVQPRKKLIEHCGHPLVGSNPSAVVKVFFWPAVQKVCPGPPGQSGERVEFFSGFFFNLQVLENYGGCWSCATWPSCLELPQTWG